MTATALPRRPLTRWATTPIRAFRYVDQGLPGADEATVVATTDAVAHESDGVRVSSPYSCIEMACIQLQAAQYQLWSAPQECTPAQLDPIAGASYRAMTALASVIKCLAATDVDTTRRATLDHSRADFEVALATLRDALGERV
jgi:hypothetical protein